MALTYRQGIALVTKRSGTSSVLHIVQELAFWARREIKLFKADQRGNVAMIFALCSIPILFAVGAAIDYTSATRRKAKLDAIADTVALQRSRFPGTRRPIRRYRARGWIHKMRRPARNRCSIPSPVLCLV